MNDVAASRACLLCGVDTQYHGHVLRQLSAKRTVSNKWKMRNLDLEVILIRAEALLIVKPKRRTSVISTNRFDFVGRECVRTQRFAFGKIPSTVSDIEAHFLRREQW